MKHVAVAFALVTALPASAQDCAEAASKFEAESCLSETLARDDGELNRAYRDAMGRAKAFDAEFGTPLPAAGTLRDAQRAWIKYRDAACGAETAPYAVGGGALLRAELACKLRYTRWRTDDLRRLAASF